MKVTAVETIMPGPSSSLPALLFVRVHTDEGLVGTGETYYVPTACRAVIHDFIAPQIIGRDPLEIDRHWSTIHGLLARFGGIGAEMRALSAIDVALWDLAGQVAALPVHALLGGASRDRIPVYNTCNGPAFGAGHRLARLGSEPAGQYDDLQGWRERPRELAQELLDEGIQGMKIWPFDEIAQTNGGLRIAPADLARGLEPIRKIRDAVGDRIEVMIDGHGYWSLAAAQEIAHALEPYRPAWIEDLTLAHDVEVLAALRASTTIPLVASEYLMTRWQFQPLFARRAMDIAMIDPTWAGGISESRIIATMASAHDMPVTMHDSTGPFTLLAGVHVALNAGNAIYQEVVRAFIRTTYADLVTEMVEIVDGCILAPSRPGIGTELQPDVANRPGTSVVRTTEADL